MKDFYIKRITNNRRILRTETTRNHKPTCDIFIQNEIQFFTYTPKTPKKSNHIFKDLKGYSDTETVLLFKKKTLKI